MQLKKKKSKYTSNTPTIDIDTEYCVLDIETTGVSF